jgi:hypothetical protein
MFYEGVNQIVTWANFHTEPISQIWYSSERDFSLLGKAWYTFVYGKPIVAIFNSMKIQLISV